MHYIEPFPKSLVDRLYGEMIDTSPVSELLKPEGEYKIPFYQFVGIAPRRYASFFVAGERKIGEDLVEFDTRRASPRIGYWSNLQVSEREATAAEAIDRLICSTANRAFRRDHQETGDKSSNTQPLDLEGTSSLKEAKESD